MMRAGSALDAHLSAFQGEFGVLHIRALAAAAGLVTTVPAPDIECVDLIIRAPSKRRRGPQLDVQVKTHVHVIPRPGEMHFSYPLDVNSYQQLREPSENGVPHILMVVLVPLQPEWVAQMADHIKLFRRAYWISLAGQPNTTNSETISVHVPTAQVLGVESLTALMEQVAQQRGLK